MSGLSLETRVGSKFPFLSLIEKAHRLYSRAPQRIQGKGLRNVCKCTFCQLIQEQIILDNYPGIRNLLEAEVLVSRLELYMFFFGFASIIVMNDKIILTFSIEITLRYVMLYDNSTLS